MDRTEWDKRLARFEAFRLLFEADDQWGALHSANQRAEMLFSYGRHVDEAAREKWQEQLSEANDREEAELSRHMREIYDPLIEAGLALIRTPAPDLAALRVKHEACSADGYRLIDYEDQEGELFAIIQADAARLIGEA
jgi:hypothetical protein